MRNANVTFSPVMPRAITDSNDGRSSGWMMSRILCTDTFVAGFELEDAKRLFRPVVIVAHQVGDEAARVAESLGIGETVVGPSQFHLRPLSVFDVDRPHTN